MHDQIMTANNQERRREHLQSVLPAKELRTLHSIIFGFGLSWPLKRNGVYK